jgi:tetratricopeptide (TPR) repeat protein/TolB-like protein
MRLESVAVIGDRKRILEMNTSSEPAPVGHLHTDDRLNSWKEIAIYLKREVRTVRRWETFESLPVHRHLHLTRGSVYAYKKEIDAWWKERRTQPRSRSLVIAVLPFEVVHGSQQDLGKAVAAEIATQLVRANLPKLRVTDGSDGEKLRALYSVGGTIHSEGPRTAINAYLQRTSDRTYVWADNYEDQQTGVYTRGRIARSVAQAVVSKLIPGEKITSPTILSDLSAVHRTCTEGRTWWNKRTAEGLVKAISCFEHAIGEDPEYAPAYAGLADSYLQLGFYGILPAVPTMKKAKTAALKAVELDDSSGEAHASLADVMKYFDWNLLGAEAEYQKAIQLDPVYATAHHWYGDYLAMMGRFDEAREKGQRALELDPVSPIINTWVGLQFYLSGRYDAAFEQLRRTREMHPSYALSRWALGLVYDQQNKFDEAISEKEEAIHLSGESPWIVAGLGCSYAAAGKRNDALRILERLIGPAHHLYPIAYEIATIYVAINDRSSALKWLQRAHEEHSAWVPFMNVEPRLKTLRGDKRFQQMASRFRPSENHLTPTCLA